MTRAEVAETLLRNDNADVALEGLVEFLKKLNQKEKEKRE